MSLKTILFATTFLAATAPAALADVSVCVSLSATGPTSALGTPQQNSVKLLPTEAAGKTVRYTVFDDASDPGAATQNARKCVNEQAADVLIGGSGTPVAAAIAAVAGETQTPFLTLSPFVPQGKQSDWTFVVPQPVSLMAGAIAEDIAKRGFKTVGLIGFNDAYGDLWIKAIGPMLTDKGITLEPVERFARTDTSVSSQVLRLSAANPEAILVVSSGAPSAGPNLALAERGYQGQIYHTHGSANGAFLKIAGDAADGTILPVGPIMVGELLPDGNPSRPVVIDYIARYEAEHGPGSVSPFGAYFYDAALLVLAAVEKVPATAEPGSPEFRSALRDALKRVEVPGLHGMLRNDGRQQMSNGPENWIMSVVDNGTWAIRD